MRRDLLVVLPSDLAPVDIGPTLVRRVAAATRLSSLHLHGAHVARGTAILTVQHDGRLVSALLGWDPLEDRLAIRLQVAPSDLAKLAMLSAPVSMALGLAAGWYLIAPHPAAWLAGLMLGACLAVAVAWLGFVWLERSGWLPGGLRARVQRSLDTLQRAIESALHTLELAVEPGRAHLPGWDGGAAVDGWDESAWNRTWLAPMDEVRQTHLHGPSGT